MGTEKVVRREVSEETVTDTSRTAPPAGAQPEVVRETVVEETAETTTRPSGVTNVNVNQDPVSGNVSISTPDGTQVNVNT